MRLAFVDILFAWPPHGGACVDVYHTVRALQALGHETRLFMAIVPGTRDRAGADPADLPFPATPINFSPKEFRHDAVTKRIREAVEAWRPDAVWVCSAFFLKPYLLEAFAEFPLIARYYAYEATAPYDPARYTGGWGVDVNLFQDPEAHRKATLRGIRPELTGWTLSSWSQEYLAACAHTPAYYRLALQATQRVDAAIVYNTKQRKLIEPMFPRVFVVPGGVDTSAFERTPMPNRTANEKKIVLMAGRAEDPAKGLHVLLEAGEGLYQVRRDFEIWATHYDYRLEREWFKPIGWRDYAAMRECYKRADFCVVPSIWPEPFGMVALEAMASGRPVIVSDTGGLGGIPEEGASGYVVPPGDSEALADRIGRLLDSESLRSRMGDAARERAEQEFQWDTLAAQHYPPLLGIIQP